MAIKTGVVHNASVLTAVGVTGLQLYKFGKITSIPIVNENIETPYDVLKKNQENDLHTLFILDLKEDSNDSLSVTDAIRYLLKVEMKRGERLRKIAVSKTEVARHHSRISVYVLDRCLREVRDEDGKRG